MAGRRDDIYSNDLEGAEFHEAQYAERPEEFWDALKEADEDMADEEDEQDEEEVSS
tara:strand:+ start:1385 stop:1552 length:168 start_codon:yes stop_codon:yes gene_type:complete